MKWPRWQNWPIVLAAGFAIFSLVALGLALAFRSADQERLGEIAQTNCRAIEAIKTQLREDARLSFRNLDRSLRILGIPKTPEIVAVSRESRDTKLERFARVEC